MTPATRSFDAAVVGLGATGGAAAYHLAKRGLRVLGLDRFTPPHALGSSHGQSRIIREAYAEHPSYVTVIQRAYELWRELEEETERALLLQTGGIIIGPPGSDVIAGAEYSARRHHLAYERVSAEVINRQFPALRPEEGTVGIWDPRAGILNAEACVEAHLNMARRHGATLRFDEPVTSWSAEGQGVSVATPRGRYRADRLVLAAGPWMTDLLEDLKLPLTVERQVMLWFEPVSNPESFSPERCPVHIWADRRDHYFYGFPDLGHGVKVARMHQGATVTADGVSREIERGDVEPVRALLARLMPDANGPRLAAEVCTFTNTPDRHFLIDRHPAYPQVLIASPCSGHGFKFASVVGEIAADLLLKGRSPHDLSLFRLDRFHG